MSKKVALLGIHHESNTFIKTQTTLEDFKNGHLLKGQDIIHEYRCAFHEIGGMLEIMEKEGIEVIPIFYAEANPGGIISAETYNTLIYEMMRELDKEMPVDGCLVVPHGAAVSESFPDMDGHWLNVLRNKIGSSIPIIGTVDPHANMSQTMVAATNGLIAYKTNPHTDQRETGILAAMLMVSILKRSVSPVQVLFSLPLAISIEKQRTDIEPCKSLLSYANSFMKRRDILSVSILLGFPYADVKEMGTSVVIIANKDKELALQVGELLSSYIVTNKQQFNGIKTDVPKKDFLRNCKRPILFLDMGDNVGGGAPGNSTYLLEAFERKKIENSFICIWDPMSVIEAGKHIIGDRFTLSIGASPISGIPYSSIVTLLALQRGHFEETKPRHGGQIHFDMGMTALVKTIEGTTIMLTSIRTLPFSLQQLLSFNLEPSSFDIIVAKGVNAPIAAYDPVCSTILQIDTPGTTGADMTSFNYHNRRKPMFPFENIC